jgi:hypothetical protein
MGPGYSVSRPTWRPSFLIPHSSLPDICLREATENADSPSGAANAAKENGSALDRAARILTRQHRVRLEPCRLTPKAQFVYSSPWTHSPVNCGYDVDGRESREGCGVKCVSGLDYFLMVVCGTRFRSRLMGPDRQSPTLRISTPVPWGWMRPRSAIIFPGATISLSSFFIVRMISFAFDSCQTRATVGQQQRSCSGSKNLYLGC